MGRFFVGLDLGQSQDFTALAVVERAETSGEFDPVMAARPKVVRLNLRFLERMELGTPYPDVVDRVGRMTRSRELAGRCQLAVDGTGVGPPVVDMLKRAQLDCRLMPVMVTGGGRESRDRGYYHVPKRDLIIGLQVLFQRGALRIAAGMPHNDTLIKEMQAMRVKVTPAGNEQYAAWREGQHDDLVFAVALACWAAKKVCPNPPMGDDRWWRNENYQHTEKTFREEMRNLVI